MPRYKSNGCELNLLFAVMFRAFPRDLLGNLWHVHSFQSALELVESRGGMRFDQDSGL
jgi:hypothetical protein